MTKDTQLALGQHLVSGNVETINVASHRIAVRALTLRLWGGHALRSGLIKTGDRAAFVYQQIPLLGLKYVLVFWKGGDWPVQGVGGLVHAVFFVLAVIGASLIPALEEGYPAWFIPVCGVLFVVSTTYLLLLFIAKRTLHALINDGVSS